jgi:multiple sugar transport system substrate-binding protein
MHGYGRVVAALAGAVVLGGTLTACGGGGGEGSAEGQTITYWATNMAPTLEGDTEIL